MTTSKTPLSANVRASLYMMLSMMGFTINDMFIKSLDGELQVGQIMAIRGSILLLIVFVIIWQQGLLRRLRELLVPTVLYRSIMEVCATLAFLTTLQALPFATIAAILQALPLAVAVGAAVFLGEPVGWRRWIAIAVGFVGVLIIIRPGLGGFQAMSLLVLLSVFFAAARDLFTRRLPAGLPSLLVSGATTFAIASAGVAITSSTGTWQSVTPQQIGIMAMAACFLFFGYQFIVMAMRTGEVAYVVPFRYTSLVWAIGLGYVVFNEIPDTLTLAGSAIVIAMGMFTLYREIVTGRRTVTSTSANAAGNAWHEKKSND